MEVEITVKEAEMVRRRKIGRKDWQDSVVHWSQYLRKKLLFSRRMEIPLTRWERMEKEHTSLGCPGRKQELDFVHLRLVMFLRRTYRHVT